MAIEKKIDLTDAITSVEMPGVDEVEESTPEEYVEKEKVTTVAINKFLDGDVTWRKTDELD